MANYAEEMAYWYLRLNGFFPLANYVYHRLPYRDQNGRYNADADILAIRPAYYYESIFTGKEGERELEDDAWLNNYRGKSIGMIVEVKGSPSVTEGKIQAAFSEERLRVAINRIGLVDHKYIDDIIAGLSGTQEFEFPGMNIIFMKVLFCMLPHNRNILRSSDWKAITLNQADEFIRQRINDYPDPKSGERYFFPGTLFQYMIWKEHPEHFDE
ncbi:MAG: hypothetical protein PHQ40_03615 [Anaerolineaceae bacterium]|nr:hypothetical protein [Anaerolineaceae bacterium]